MTEKELYNLMMPMATQFEKYKNKQLSALSADEVAQMGIIFNGVKQVYPISGLPRLFTSSCSSCIISTLEKFIMIYDRLHPIYKVDEALILPTKEDAPEVIKTRKNKRIKKDGM